MSNTDQTQYLTRSISFIAQEDIEDLKNDLLPFMDSKTTGPNIWIGKSTGDKERDKELGEYYAALYVAHCHYEGGAGWNLGAIVAAMPNPIGELEKSFINNVGYFAGNWMAVAHINEKKFEGKRSSGKKYYRYKRTADYGESVTIFKWHEHDDGKLSIKYNGTCEDLIALGLLPERMFQETRSTVKKGNVYLPDGDCVSLELRAAGKRNWEIEWERIPKDKIPYTSDKAKCTPQNECEFSIRWRKEREEKKAQKEEIHGHCEALFKAAGYLPQKNPPTKHDVIISANGLFKHRALLNAMKAAEDYRELIPIYAQIKLIPEEERQAIEAKWYIAVQKLCPPELKATPEEMAAIQQEGE